MSIVEYIVLEESNLNGMSFAEELLKDDFLNVSLAAFDILEKASLRDSKNYFENVFNQFYSRSKQFWRRRATSERGYW